MIYTVAMCCLLLYVLPHTSTYYCIVLYTAKYSYILLCTAAVCYILLHSARYSQILLHSAIYSAFCCYMPPYCPMYGLIRLGTDCVKTIGHKCRFPSRCLLDKYRRFPFNNNKISDWLSRIYATIIFRNASTRNYFLNRLNLWLLFIRMARALIVKKLPK